MEKLVDEIVLLVLCVLVAMLTVPDSFLIVGFLAAIILISGTALSKRTIRLAVEGGFYIVSFFIPTLIAFLPVATYVSMHERRWVLRLIWILSLMSYALGGLNGDAAGKLVFEPITLLNSTTLTVLCLVAIILAVRNVRACSELEGMRFAYDDLREHYFEMRQELDQIQSEEKENDQDNASQTFQNQSTDIFADLSKRELAVARLVAEGMDNREIASSLFLSEGTVRNHISSILAKKNLNNRTQIAIAYIRGR